MRYIRAWSRRSGSVPRVIAARSCCYANGAAAPSHAGRSNTAVLATFSIRESRGAAVVMMKPVKDWQRDDVPGEFLVR